MEHVRAAPALNSTSWRVKGKLGKERRDEGSK